MTVRSAFTTQLTGIEDELVHVLRDVPPALALVAVANGPARDQAVELLAADAMQLRGRCRAIDSALMTLAACQAPMASDLRLVLALLEVSHHAMLICNQLRMIDAQLLDIGDAGGLSPDTSRRVDQMVVIAGGQLDTAVTAFCARRPGATAEIDSLDSRLDRLNRELFACARDLEGSAAGRSVAMRHVLIARSIERIGDNALGIARQIAFVVGDRLQDGASTVALQDRS